MKLLVDNHRKEIMGVINRRSDWLVSNFRHPLYEPTILDQEEPALLFVYREVHDQTEVEDTPWIIEE